MQRSSHLVFALIAVLAIGVACSEHPSVVPSAGGDVSLTKRQSGRPEERPRSRRIVAGRIQLIGIAMGKRKPAFVREVNINGPLPKVISASTFSRLLSMSKPISAQEPQAAKRMSPLGKPTPTPAPTPTPSAGPSPTPTPNAEPTAWCPQGASSTNLCEFIQPETYDGQLLWCINCTSQEVPTAQVWIDPAETPPPDFTVQAVSSEDLQDPVDCSSPGPSGSPACTVTTCYQPEPTCYVLITWTANLGAPPANIVGQDQISEPGYLNVPAGYNNWFTVPPVVMDLDLTQTDQVVSSPHPTPLPIMVGNEVVLQAWPPGPLTSVTWNFDEPSTADVVGSYGLVGTPPASPVTNPIQSIASPSPLASGANPTRFYWVSGSTGWLSGLVAPKHLWLLAYASGVQGPLVADVYYPVAAPSPVVNGPTANPMALPTDYAPNGPPSCPGTETVISVSDPCVPGVRGEGVYAPYDVGVPSWGTGWIGIAQLGRWTVSGESIDGVVLPQAQTDSTYDLDGSFPNVAPVTTNTVTLLEDWPAYPIYPASETRCETVTYSGYVTDYFMYEPSVPTSRQGAPIWVTQETMPWNPSSQPNYTATAQIKGSGWHFTGQLVNPSINMSNVTPSTQLPAWPNVILPGQPWGFDCLEVQ